MAGLFLKFIRIVFSVVLLVGYTAFMTSRCYGQAEFNINGNRRPCVGAVETYIADGAHGCGTVEVQFVIASEGFHYEVLNTTANSKTVRWLHETGFVLRGVFKTCPNGDVSYSDSRAGSARPLPASLPVSADSLSVDESHSIALRVPGYTGDLKWYEGDKLATPYFDNILPARPAGIYEFEGRVVNPDNCPVAIPTITMTVTVTPVVVDMNWVETKGFDDSTLVSHGIAYFGPAGEALQSQVRSLEHDQVLTSVVVKDKIGRPVVSTLTAPTGIKSFAYRRRFFVDTTGSAFNYADLANGRSGNQQGSVGWYYSTSNTMEKHVPATQYPYTRNDYYYDGTNEVRFSAGPGEAHRFRNGSGNETLTGRFPVVHELDDYVAKRNASVVPGGTMTARGLQGTVSVVRDANHHYGISVVDGAGRTLMTAHQGSPTDYDLAVNNTLISHISNSSSPYYNRSTYFYLLNTSLVTFNADQSYASIYYNDLCAASDEYNYAQPGVPIQMNDGFYRIKVIVSGYEVSVVHTHYLKDIAYFFYDDAGRLISSVSPNGFKQWNAGTPYSQIDKKWQVYDFRGQVTSSHDPDAGSVNYLYRKDGAIRFSQNDKQAAERHFSYTLYDRLGRPVESGEYTGSTYKFGSGLSGQLEYAKQVNFPTDSTRDWLKTRYDYADNDPVTGFLALTHLSAGDYEQRFVRGGVSATENVHIRTWYSYDELGRVTWMAQKPKALDRVFVVTYHYDYLGNVLHTGSFAYNVTTGAKLKEFYHHYEYDKDKRLSKAYTSERENGTRKLRATYEYYIHGPLKRIVLGNKAQGIDFVYNIQGWLKQINHPDPMQDPGEDGNDAFGMVLDYYESDMNNLYPTAAMVDPYRGHTTFGQQSVAANNHAPLIRFAPESSQLLVQPAGSSLKDFSASNPRYKKMLNSLTTPAN